MNIQRFKGNVYANAVLNGIVEIVAISFAITGELFPIAVKNTALGVCLIG